MMLALAFLLAGTAAPFNTAPVADSDLAGMRGGFSVAGSPDVSVAVRTETTLDGALLLRSVWRVDNGAPALQVYAPAPGQKIAMAGGQSPANSGAMTSSPIVVTFDRETGARIASTANAQPSISVVVGQAAPPPDNAGPPLDLSKGAVATAGGAVSLQKLPVGTAVHLAGDRLDVTQLFGAAIGSAIANSADNRAIQSATTVGLDLRGATPFNLGAAVLRAQDVAADAVRQLVVR